MRLKCFGSSAIVYLLPVLLFTAAGCDPCAGVSSCNDSPAIRYEGLVRLRSTGEPVVDTRVEFVRTGGVSLGRDSLITQTDAEGRFLLEADASEQGEVRGVLSVYSPGSVAPSRFAVALATLRSSANVAYLGEFSVPFFHLPYVGVLFYADTEQPAAGVEVEFRRTGGIQLAQDNYLTRTDASGMFHLGPLPLEPGTVVADLIVRPSAPYRAFTIDDIHLETVEGEVQPIVAGRWPIPREGGTE